MGIDLFNSQQEIGQKPLVSVIVPIYRAEETLLRCLDSLRAQSLKDFEVLMVDDGSPDHCGEMIDDYAQKDSRFKAFHKENGGVSSARQFGIDHAIGEYTIHADPDDWVEPSMLEDLYRKAAEEEADMVICDFLVNTYKGQEYMCQKPTSLHHDVVLRELFGRIHGSCCNKLIKLSCINKYNIKFPNGFSSCEDQYVIASLLKEDIRVSYLPNAYYHYYRDNPSSLSRKYTKQTYEADLRARDMFYDLLEGTDIQQRVYDYKTYLILCGAFYGGRESFTSKEFRDYFSEYKSRISSPITFRKVLMKLSCNGFYQFSIGIYSCLQRVKRVSILFISLIN